MIWLTLVIATILSCELFVRLPLLSTLNKLWQVFEKIWFTLGSRSISDHWKERVLPVYGLRIVSFSIQGFALLLLALLPFAVASMASKAMNFKFIQLVTGVGGIAAITAIAWAYLAVRKKLPWIKT